MDHQVTSGDCIISLAHANGLRTETIWGAPENASLKQIRGDGGLLLEGDRVFIPERHKHTVAVATDECHTFVRRGALAYLRFQFSSENDSPIADAPFVLKVENRVIRGTTDSDGFIEEAVPAGARRGSLCLDVEGRSVSFEVRIGDLDPVGESSGQHARLSHLGFDTEPAKANQARLSEAFDLFRREFGAESGDRARLSQELLRRHGA